MFLNFGQLLEQKRTEAGLSIEELALMSKLTVDRLQDLERGQGEMPSFDICYRLGQAITSRSGRQFVIQDLWDALKGDKPVSPPKDALRETKDDAA